MVEDTIAIAIDGPAAAGKSTVAKIIADKLKFVYIDTGAMYRALTWKVLINQINITAEQEILNMLKKTKIELRNDGKRQLVLLDDVDVTEEIRQDHVSVNVSQVAKLSSIREEMVRRQQELANNRSVVMDGRDIGTHVLPNAQLKIFLIASATERANRRFAENKKRGISADYSRLVEEIEKRDETDINRKVSPLLKAEDAVEVNTTNLTIDQVVERILSELKEFYKI